LFLIDRTSRASPAESMLVICRLKAPGTHACGSL